MKNKIKEQQQKMGLPDLKSVLRCFIGTVCFTTIFVWLYINLKYLSEEKRRDDLSVQAKQDYDYFLQKYHKIYYDPLQEQIRQLIFTENHYFVNTFEGHNLKLNHMADWTKKELNKVLNVRQSYQGQIYKSTEEPKPVDWTWVVPPEVFQLSHSPSGPEYATMQAI